MEILTVQHIGDKRPAHIITECADTDTCPGCGAGYKVGMSQCEYCLRPVQRTYYRRVYDEIGIWVTNLPRWQA